ncbi:MAG: M56 family metallopeptidase [candidate division NC10 bacterium]|nr:M56 family metallopeptidase [candidate division NC10 bacterium]
MKAMTLQAKDPSRLPFLVLLGLGALPLAALVVAVGAMAKRELPATLIDACVHLMDAALAIVRSHFPFHPITTWAVILVGASFLWAFLRATASLLSGRTLCKRLEPYRADRWAKLDQVLDSAPALKAMRLQTLETFRPLAFTAGFFRPVVCISAGLVDLLSEGELRAVLFHERAHAKRRDPLCFWIVRLLKDALWFLPMARLLAAAVADLAEQAADDHALMADATRLDLAEAIVKTAMGGLALELKGAALLQGRLSIEERVMRLLTPERSLSPGVSARRVVVSGIALVVLVGALMGPSLADPAWHSQGHGFSLKGGITCHLPSQP